MAQQSTSIDQTLIDEPIPRLQVQTVHESKLTEGIINDLLANFAKNRSIGLSPTYLSGKLTVLAIANTTNVLVVQFFTTRRGRDGPTITVQQCSPAGRQLLEDKVLCSPHARIAAFDLHNLALLLHRNHQVRLVNGVDIQSCCGTKDRHPITSVKFAVGENIEIFQENIINIFRDMEHCEKRMEEVVSRAWISHYITQLDGMEDRIEKAPKIDTTGFNDQQLSVLGGVAHDSLRSYMEKPTEVKHDVDTNWDSKNSKLQVQSNNFKNRLARQNQDQNLQVRVEGSTGSFILRGNTDNISGRSGSVNAPANFSGRVVANLVTVGREAPTNAEAQRDATVLRILQGNRDALAIPWIQNIWFSPDSWTWPVCWQVAIRADPITLEDDPKRPLNDSQKTAIQRMLSHEDKDRIVIIQGPPGTGKTSVISCFVKEAINAGYTGIWLVAQSNVAVKNIAEKLIAYDFMNWRLLVSVEFHFDWHEHLYQRVARNVIKSNELTDRGFNARATLRGCQVVLCTLSMLSSISLKISGVANVVPIKYLVVDEASQIEVGDYIPVFSKYRSIRKICFIGDDKQLPPHGQEEINELQSIFEQADLRKKAIFLDTQYRMPPQLGDFISTAVYDDGLQSNPLHPVRNTVKACHFIDVIGGKEEFRSKSWMNRLECQAVLDIARHLETTGKQYRVITPYEGQRSAIEDRMKEEGLQWGDKCFNVDSFQGNEDDYIIISLVRSRELGFLKNLRRTNVMLTRCRFGMFICSSKAFLKGMGSKSLVGQLLKHVGEDAWLDLKGIEKVRYHQA